MNDRNMKYERVEMKKREVLTWEKGRGGVRKSNGSENRE